MAVYSKKLHIKKGTSQQDIDLYTTTGEVGNNRLCLKDGSATVYAKLVSTSDSRASSLRVIKNNVTYAVAKTGVIAKNNVFAAVLSFFSPASSGTRFTFNLSIYRDLREHDLNIRTGDIIVNVGSILSFTIQAAIYGLTPNTKYRIKFHLGSITVGGSNGFTVYLNDSSVTTTTDDRGETSYLNFSFSGNNSHPADDFKNKGMMSGISTFSFTPI